MISVSSGHSAGYLTGSVGAGMEGYYTGAAGPGEPAGRWQGRGAERLGLAGVVDADVMHALYGQFRDPRDPRFADPDTRDQAGRTRPCSEAVPHRRSRSSRTVSASTPRSTRATPSRSRYRPGGSRPSARPTRR